MSTARHHAEWLSLIEVSGPFLSMPVLMNSFPQGLDAVDSDLAAELRAAYEEWADNQGGLRPDPAIHTAWIRYVLTTVLEMPEQTIAEGQAIPAGLKSDVAEHHETLRPDLVILDPENSRPRLLIDVYPADQGLEKAIPGSRWQASPATRMMELLHTTETRLGLVTNGEQWLLVQAKRGETTGFAGWYAPLWLEERLTLRAFRSLLAVSRFFGVPDDQTLEALLDQSAQDQAEVTDQLGYQVRQAVEILVQSIDEIDQDRNRELLHEVSEDRLYEAALTVMMRLVFLLAAEERGLLLLGDPVYDQSYAVSTLRAQLREAADRYGEEVLGRGYDAWCRLLATWRAVYGGIHHENLHLPAYGGSLFDPDRFPFLEGRAADSEWQSTTADPLPIDNRTVLHLLEALQMLQMKTPGSGSTQARRLSFRALDIEQIGHVYEGLLDHKAVRAADPVLGLQGTKDKEPEIPLPELEAQKTKGEDALVAFLKDQTGRSVSALRRALANTELDHEAADRLRVACDNDPALAEQVRPWAGLLRKDDFGYPVVVPAGSVYVTTGATRRSTGTHYTPRSLTEPIVRHTLEPQVYRGPAEGTPRDQWQLKSPAELLELKVCDMAMGSGAFLVQACRYLSERLAEAWDDVGGDDLQITPEGRPATGDPAEMIIPADPEERLALARRLVADRCLYGVDKNPLAVEMAKLSLWLITLDKGRPFTFLDHALKHGDSLIGADENMFLRWSESLKGTIGPLYFEQNEAAIAEARRLRRQLQAMPERDVRDAEEKARLNRQAEAALARIKLGCDLLVGVELVEGVKPAEREAWQAELLIEYTARETPTSDKAVRALSAARGVDAFHWSFEFPEAFAVGGFNAIVGNPPFQGGQKITGTLGKPYRDYIVSVLAHGVRGSADLCAYFYLRACHLIRAKGLVGFIATNTISEGDTREVGLDQILALGFTVVRACASTKWPGTANLEVAQVWLQRGEWRGEVVLDDVAVKEISPYLSLGNPLSSVPKQLAAQKDKAFIGAVILGLGFTLDPEEVEALVANEPHSREVIFPYLNGSDLNSHPEQQPSRFIINFRDWPIERAMQYPACFEIVRQRVKPERDQITYSRRGKELWWQHYRPSPNLHHAIKQSDAERVLVASRVSKYLAHAVVDSHWVFDVAINIIVQEIDEIIGFLHSCIYESWVRQHSSTLETRLRYTLTDSYETFPMPKHHKSVSEPGTRYDEKRKEGMLSRVEGMTDFYNRLHDPRETSQDIAGLRVCQIELDNVVAIAYGWTDLGLDHGFHETPHGVRFTISEPARREVLSRLLQLNHERYEEEVRQGLHEKGKKGGKKAKKDSGQLSLL